jgi:hypothetical protein
MKKQLLCVLISAATLQVASAEKWEPSTHECSLVFPDSSWNFQQGKEVEHGQIILTAINRERTKDVNVVRYTVAASISVQDARFVDGIKSGFAKSGGRMLSSGYTNVNGRVAYWFAGEGFANGRKISTLRYAICENGRLYQLMAESIGSSPQNDDELSAILDSFQIHAEALPSATASRYDSLAFKIGLITGFLLFFIAAGGTGVKLFRKRA